MKIIHKMNIRRILSQQPKDSMVVFKTQQYGMFWAGKVKFAFSHRFITLHPTLVNRDSTGALVITI